jgi:predicted transcriptional regulator
MVSVAGTISVISDEKALSLFKAVALSEKDNTSGLITKLGLTHRQYYSIIKKLIDTGLVKRISGNYSLTSFGKITFYIQVKKIETAIKHYWELTAVDSIIEYINRKDLPIEEYQRIVDNLIDNHEIKAILISNDQCESNQSYDAARQQLRQRQQTHQLKQELLMQ